jgi:hypothetical protein
MTNNQYDDRIPPRSPFADPSPYGDEYDAYEYDDGFDDEVPRAPLPLEPAQTRSLAAAIDAILAARGCDNTLRSAMAWARQEKVRWGWLRNELEQRGGFCDCEVLFNVVPPPEE